MNLTIKKEWFDAAEVMTDPLQIAGFYQAITEFFFTGKEPDADNPALVFFNLIRPEIERDIKAKNKRAERKAKISTKKQPDCDQQTTDTRPQNDQAPTVTKKFIKPTAEQIREYCKEKNYTTVDACGFINYYESNGWKVGHNPMKNWKAAVTTWSARAYNNKKSGAVWGNENAVPDSIVDLL